MVRDQTELDKFWLKKITQIFLEVRVSNESAKALYLKLGFKPVGIRKNYYENSEDAIVMLKVLCIDWKHSVNFRR